MTCDDVRELLPDHVLGTLEGPAEVDVRRHLRGCAGCRGEMAALGEGVASFARAAHDESPPPELGERVLGALRQDWHDAGRPDSSPGRARWLATAAAAVLVVASLAWGAVQTRRANVVADAAASYTHLLSDLGGTEFRIGQLRSPTGATVGGSVVLYDSLEQSWGVVLMRAPGLSGAADVTLEATDGRTIDVPPLEFQPDGDAATWIVTSADLTAFDRVTVTAADGTVLATAEITVA